MSEICQNHECPTLASIPTSLFNVCLDYISRHMGLVESLENLPQIIGEQILACCLDKRGSCSCLNKDDGCLDKDGCNCLNKGGGCSCVNKTSSSCQNSGCILARNSPVTQHVIRLYVDAYGQEFIKTFKPFSLSDDFHSDGSSTTMTTSLNAHRQRLVMEYSECLCVLVVPLTHLDLSGGCLTGCSDLLRCVCEAVNLHTLDISNNALTHTDFRLLLARYRMHRLGFKMLECLNMSGNTVTLKVLKCFLNMPRLCHLRVSRASTLTEKCPNFVRDWNTCTKEHNFVEHDFSGHTQSHASIDHHFEHTQSHTKKQNFDHTRTGTHQILAIVKTEGFGKDIVKIWEKVIIELEKEQTAKFTNKKSNTQNFNSQNITTPNFTREQSFVPPTLAGSFYSSHYRKSPTRAIGLQNKIEEVLYDTLTYRRRGRLCLHNTHEQTISGSSRYRQSYSSSNDNSSSSRSSSNCSGYSSTSKQSSSKRHNEQKQNIPNKQQKTTEHSVACSKVKNHSFQHHSLSDEELNLFNIYLNK